MLLWQITLTLNRIIYKRIKNSYSLLYTVASPLFRDASTRATHIRTESFILNNKVSPAAEVHNTGWLYKHNNGKIWNVVCEIDGLEFGFSFDVG